MSGTISIARGAVAALAALGVAAYAAAALVTVADVLGRLVGFGIIGVVDLVQLFVMAGAWLVMPFTFMTAAHVSVDFVIARLPGAMRGLFRVAAAIIALMLVTLMLWQGYATFETRTMFGDTSQQLGIPIAWFWYPLIAGLVVCIPAIVLWLVSALGGGDDG